MNKIYIILLFFVITTNTYGQEKYALVIGNSDYTNFGTLQNPVNDANDMKDVLENLGFIVDILLDGTLNQMENAAIRLRNRLSEAGNDSISFFYYAGHGLEMSGINYLIPADANIPDRNFLRERAFSVQIMLDMLNDSRNSLNIVVLDACRDFPASWGRSLNRGLAVISNPPANHIIMYATGAGNVANDGIGRNGLFTGYLLENLKQTELDINEIFRRTMGDVAESSNNQQRPALYTDFAKTIYFDSEIAREVQNTQTHQIITQTIPVKEEPRYQNFNTGQRVGTAFLNYFPGLGSFIIMHDWLGGSIQLGLFAGGMALSISSTFNMSGSDTATPVGFWVGLGIVTGSYVFEIIRSITYNKPFPKTASLIDPKSWNIAVAPGKNGIDMVQLAYTIRF